MNHKAQFELETRMRNFDGYFDGYPSITEFDVNLIVDAVQNDSVKLKHYVSFEKPLLLHDVVTHLSYTASSIQDNREDYDNAMRFLNAYVENTICCNMIEGDNPFYAEDNADA